MTIVLQSQHEANVFWSTREFKKWTVTLQGPKRTLSTSGRDGQWVTKRVARVVEMYVSARTVERAIACAVANCHVAERWINKTARLATAQDLGCVHVPGPALGDHCSDCVTRSRCSNDGCGRYPTITALQGSLAS